MSNQIVISKNSTELTDEMVATLIQAGVIPIGTPMPQIKVFAQFCKDKGLSPFAKEVYLLGFGGVYSRIVGIDGFRKIAARTGQLAGCDDVKFDIKSDGSWLTANELIEKKQQFPKTATITVWRIVAGMRVGFTHTAVFSEFTTGKQKWITMSFQMISKVAETFAIRKGFSDETSGLSIEEEIGAIQDLQAIDAETPFKKGPEPKDELSLSHKYYEQIVIAIKSGKRTVVAIEEKFTISEEVRSQLDLDVKNPKLDPKNPAHFVDYQEYTDGNISLEDLKSKYFVTKGLEASK